MFICVGNKVGGYRGDTAANPPPASPVLAHYIAEARKKAEEVRKKTGQWSRRLTQIHQLTMHTAVSRKDNDTPAAVTMQPPHNYLSKMAIKI